ncbi:hypothetical protein BP5796_01138 [Coleophoma crateriformis]|uniref:Rhamnogalacturonase A n=1 Tax=Coleophoma crateriformis TaxID=565419 RepID=A0A3D8SZM0_9HELO|nr:hypothetical protein BP5796_01138 [Coleophoma crateriformis]
MLYSILLGATLVAQACAQLTGSVGPLLSAYHKGNVKVCDIRNYGATSSADVGPPIVAAWTACAAVGGLVYIPPGSWPLRTRVDVRGGAGNSIAIQWDGTIYRDSTTMTYQMFTFTNVNDFELFSGNSKGALQGYGYQYLSTGTYGVRMMRLVGVTNFSVHGIAFVDSPSYYIVFDTCSKGEVYNLILRGSTTLGATDGIDVTGDNMWLHDIEVTNGDECVTVKSPASNFLIQGIYCNRSGGTAIGSLGLDTAIENIQYQHLYMNEADACFLKSNGGSGYVTNVSWRDVTVHGSAYPLTIDLAWGTDNGGPGITVSNLEWMNYFGYNDVHTRAAIRLQCSDSAPCYGLTLNNVHMWTSDGGVVTYGCTDAYGVGACMVNKPASPKPAAYTSVQSVTTTSSLVGAATMAADFKTALSPTGTIAIPAIPTSFYPGQTPQSALLALTTVI